MIRGAKSERCAKLIAFAAFFVAPCAYALVTTDVLPKGVRAAAVVWGASKTVTSSFGPQGDVGSLVAPLNLSLSLQDLGEFEGQAKDLASVLNSLSPDQLGDKLLLTDLYSEVAVREQRTVFGLLWGLHQKWSLGLIVPIVHRKARFSFRAEVVDNSEAYSSLIGQVPKLQDALQQIKESSIGTQTFANAIFTENGYVIPQDQDFYSLGDIELESRWRYLSLKRSDFAMRVNFRMPTATHRTDLHNLLDRPVGDESFSLRLGSVHSLKILPGRLTLLGGVFGTVYTPHTKRMGVPLSESQALPNLKDPQQIAHVTKLRSPQLNTDIGLMLDFWKGALSFSASHLFLIKGRDQYRGNKKGLAYSYYETNTEGWEQGVEISGEISTIPLYLDNIFPAPGKFTFTWYQPYKGKNQIIAPFGRIDFVMLF